MVVFHDDLRAEDEQFIRHALDSVYTEGLPQMQMHFVKHILDFPVAMSPADRERVREQPKAQQCKASLGYRHMCRFHSFVAADLLAQKGFTQQYIMRLDDDSHFSAPVSYDLFKAMHVNDKRCVCACVCVCLYLPRLHSHSPPLSLFTTTTYIIHTYTLLPLLLLQVRICEDHA